MLRLAAVVHDGSGGQHMSGTSALPLVEPAVVPDIGPPATARPGGPGQRGCVRDKGHIEARWPADAAMVALGRRVARDVCARWFTPDVCDSLLLVVSELLGNAAKAATGPEMTMRLYWTSRRVRVEVTDDSPEDAVARGAQAHEEGGRGLWLVQMVATRWGSHPYGARKCVWAEIALDP